MASVPKRFAQLPAGDEGTAARTNRGKRPSRRQLDPAFPRLVGSRNKHTLVSYLVRVRVYLFPRQVAQEAYHRGNRHSDEGSQLGPIAAQNSEHIDLDVDVLIHHVCKREQKYTSSVLVEETNVLKLTNTATPNAPRTDEPRWLFESLREDTRDRCDRFIMP